MSRRCDRSSRWQMSPWRWLWTSNPQMCWSTTRGPWICGFVSIFICIRCDPRWLRQWLPLQGHITRTYRFPFDGVWYVIGYTFYHIRHHLFFMFLIDSNSQWPIIFIESQNRSSGTQKYIVGKGKRIFETDCAEFDVYPLRKQCIILHDG